MNKLEIICYIISAFFMGISAGCLIAAGVHRRIWGHKSKPKGIDKVHEHQDPAVYAAIVQGMKGKRFSGPTPFFGCYEDEVFLPRINESKAEREEKERLQKQLAARHLLAELEEAGAIRYDIKTSEPTEFMTQRVLCVAKLNVLMPEKKEAQQ